ncbi:MAG: hypothetical protein ACLTG0_15155 [Oscillibacter sp.]
MRIGRENVRDAAAFSARRTLRCGARSRSLTAPTKKSVRCARTRRCSKEA